MIPAYTAYGDGPPLLILHGLFGSGRNWASMAKRFAAGGRKAITADLRNHGASDHDDAMSYPLMAEDVVGLIHSLELERPVVIGHSMGGKTSMALALSHPEMLRALVVVDIAPVPYGHSNAALIEAMAGIDLKSVSNRGDADAALAETFNDPGIRAFLLQNLNFEEGRASWRLNLQALSANMPALTDFPFQPGESAYEGPTLFVGGTESDYMRDVDRNRIREFFPASRVALVKGAGHWVHAEAPEAFFEIVSGFLGALQK